MIPSTTIAQWSAENADAKNPDTWHEVLLMDDQGLPAGRQWERYVFSRDRLAVEIKVYLRPDIDPNAEPVYEGWHDGGQICLSNDKQSCMEFLVDWAGKNDRS
jgi:hypothetical protein